MHTAYLTNKHANDSANKHEKCHYDTLTNRLACVFQHPPAFECQGALALFVGVHIHAVLTPLTVTSGLLSMARKTKSKVAATSGLR